MNSTFPPPCVHGDGTDLCEDCREVFNHDPESYLEYGNHPDGLRRFAELLRELDQRPAPQPCPAWDIPF